MSGETGSVHCRNNPSNSADITGKFYHVIFGACLGGITSALIGVISGQSGWRLTATIVVGVIAGALAAATGAWIGGLVKGTGGVLLGGAAGGALGNLINTLFDEIASGKGVNWGRVGRAIGIGGVLGLCFGVVGAAAQRNGDIAAAIASIDGDLWGNAMDAYNQQG